MSGIYTPGLPSFTGPWQGTELFPCDTGYPQGENPETAAVSSALLGLIGLGPNVQVAGPSGSTALAVNAQSGSSQTITLNNTGYVLTIANPSPGQQMVLELVQGTGGSKTITTYTNVLFAGGTHPVLSTAAGAIDVLELVYDATRGKWLGIVFGAAFA